MINIFDAADPSKLWLLKSEDIPIRGDDKKLPESPDYYSIDGRPFVKLNDDERLMYSRFFKKVFNSRKKKPKSAPKKDNSKRLDI